MYRRTNYTLFPGFVAAAVAATLPPASVDPEGQDWIPLDGGGPLGGGPLGGGRCSSTSAFPRRGLSLSIEIDSARPPMARRKTLGPLSRTWYGPR